MPSTKEIIDFTKHTRGKHGAWKSQYTPDLPRCVTGQCANVQEIVDQFQGQHWRSELAKYSPQQVHPGHSLGIIPTYGQAGIIIEYSRPHGFVIGSVRDMSDTKAIEVQLEAITGYSGWKNK